MALYFLIECFFLNKNANSLKMNCCPGMHQFQQNSYANKTGLTRGVPGFLLPCQINSFPILLANCQRSKSLKTSCQLRGSRTAQLTDSVMAQMLRIPRIQTLPMLLFFQHCGEPLEEARKHALSSSKENFGPSTAPEISKSHSTVLFWNDFTHTCAQFLVFQETGSA